MASTSNHATYENWNILISTSFANINITMKDRKKWKKKREKESQQTKQTTSDFKKSTKEEKI